jgi:hypothetical protein
MEIQVQENEIKHLFTVQDMISLGSTRVNIAERVPGIDGMAMDLTSWYALWVKWSGQPISQPPTHLRVEAEDEFSATIAWPELQTAVLLYEQGGAPLQKGYPLRLYVPDGSSACLNVKSVIKLEFLHQADLGNQAAYGFKNNLSPLDLRMKKT